ncbi:hypothetical protein N7540_005560 [Penicillium herquei]|nr:hypothetical protein N7540_005560 [Penicillium herquei]
MAFKPLLPPDIISRDSQNDAATAHPRKIPSLDPIIRDLMTTSSWLLLGGLLQSLARMAFGPKAILPSALILLYRFVDNMLMIFHITRNRYLDGAIMEKVSPQIPNPDGSFGSEPSDASVVVFLLGSRSNHPLGVLAPGMIGMGLRVKDMIAEMYADPEKSGILGTSRWVKQEDAAGNESMNVFYLRDYDSLRRFANGEMHMESVRYWAKLVKENPHLTIYHETYVVPKGHWEAIYVHSKPTGLGNTWFPTRSKDSSGPISEYTRPLVDASTGLRSASGRLPFARGQKSENFPE